MKRDEVLQLIDALLARPDAIGDARAAFARRFPDAPKEMIDTATFHVCVDGIDAALAWLASIEKFLQKPDDGLAYGATWHLLHHLYNWQQFESLLPLGKTGIADHLGDIRTFLDEPNPDAARQTIDHLLKCLSGDLESRSME
ncbi:hypothetical protein [Rhodopirellula sp. MGV]|uniref:hypothetical protein n=1 Tax=Rhodopirellula sp. MGV TaxID=2023130 RepID=UPI000B970BFE|nr:hypothetical protein [Rhodopirellula sp. MGV]OYP34331.1 hypothetical protein CGZ80_14805 [Rhodopirellula sp. MGV]PNY35268.1 hypothetical protein C2E31_19185 [Rhodopirellula baltica]